MLSIMLDIHTHLIKERSTISSPFLNDIRLFLNDIRLFLNDIRLFLNDIRRFMRTATACEPRKPILTGFGSLFVPKAETSQRDGAAEVVLFPGFLANRSILGSWP
jgi:hypothetical protein